MDDSSLSKEISDTFAKNREERIKFIGEDQSQEIEKEFSCNQLILIGNLIFNI